MFFSLTGTCVHVLRSSLTQQQWNKVVPFVSWTIFWHIPPAHLSFCPLETACELSVFISQAVEIDLICWCLLFWSECSFPFVIYLFGKRLGLKLEYYKVSSDESHKVLTVVASFLKSLDCTEDVCLFTYLQVSFDSSYVWHAFVCGNGEYHKQGERKIGVLCYQKEPNNHHHNFTAIIKKAGISLQKHCLFLYRFLYSPYNCFVNHWLFFGMHLKNFFWRKATFLRSKLVLNVYVMSDKIG